jgi:hypothetical protein
MFIKKYIEGQNISCLHMVHQGQTIFSNNLFASVLKID